MILRSQGVSKAHIPVLQCCTRLMNCINKVMFAIYEMFGQLCFSKFEYFFQGSGIVFV